VLRSVHPNEGKSGLRTREETVLTIVIGHELPRINLRLPCSEVTGAPRDRCGMRSLWYVWTLAPLLPPLTEHFTRLSRMQFGFMNTDHLSLHPFQGYHILCPRKSVTTSSKYFVLLFWRWGFEHTLDRRYVGRHSVLCRWPILRRTACASYIGHPSNIRHPLGNLVHKCNIAVQQGARVSRMSRQTPRTKPCLPELYHTRPLTFPCVLLQMRSCLVCLFSSSRSTERPPSSTPL
jgi:hypothetical protein